MLEWNRGEKSSRWKHLKELPQTFNSPLLWSDAEMYNLTGSAYQMLAMYLRKQVEEEYHLLMEKVHRRQSLEAPSEDGVNTEEEQTNVGEEVSKETLSLDTYRWARACVQSRSMILSNDLLDEFLCLPGGGADMFNHSPAAGPGR